MKKRIKKRVTKKTTYRLLSFDIGAKNFAFYIEQFKLSDLKELEIPKVKMIKGKCSEEYKKFLEKVFKNGERIILEVFDLRGKDEFLYDQDVLVNMYDVLDDYSELFDTCNGVIIEQQMQFFGRGNSARNIIAVKLAQHCHSYFIHKYRETIPVAEFPAFHKTQVLAAPLNLNKYHRKKWAVVQAKDILKMRKDEEGYRIISIIHGDKADDVSDVIVQAQAFKILAFIQRKWK